VGAEWYNKMTIRKKRLLDKSKRLSTAKLPEEPPVLAGLLDRDVGINTIIAEMKCPSGKQGGTVPPPAGPLQADGFLLSKRSLV
jgi:hypothetical protein